MISALLMTQSLDIGGTERQIAEVAKALPAYGVEACVGSLRPGGMRAQELQKAGVEVLSLSLYSFLSPGVWRPAREFVRFLRTRKIQVMHAFDPPGAIFATPLAKLARTPLVLSSMRGERRSFPKKVQRALRVTDRLADAVVVNCEFLRQELITRYGLSPTRLELCYNGVDRRVFQPHPRDRPPQLAAASVVIGCVAALRPEKSITTLIDAVARLKAPGVHLVIVGSGPEEQRLREAAQASGLTHQQRCLFVPATSEVAKWNRAIDIFVLPSLTEAFSNSLLEAISCGCAVIGSRVGGTPELILDGQTGLLFDPGDAIGLAAAIEKLAADPQMRAKLSTAAQQRLEHELRIEHAAATMASIYKRRLALRSGQAVRS